MSKNKNVPQDTDRSKVYTCVVYPDSCRPDWLQTLQSLKMEIAISPLHDQDVNEDGEFKKPHYHVVFLYDGLKTRFQAIKDFDLIGGVYPKRDSFDSDVDWFTAFDFACVARSRRGLLRYLIHADNPEKHLYSINDVISLGGLDFDSIFQGEVDNLQLVADICDFCEREKIVSFARLVHYARQYKPIWLRSLVGSAYFYKCFLTSSEWQNKPPKGFYLDD